MGFSATVPRFGMVLEVNLARTFLFRAHDALEAGRILEAGVLLREAIRRQLVAECNWHGCLPKGFSDRTPPLVLLKALRNAGKCGYCGFDWTKEMIGLANRCCHAQHVNPSEVSMAITIMHTSIDNDPCGEPRERTLHSPPTLGLFGKPDDDDDDAGEAWKAGAK